jgi:UDP-glucose 4-epimerase
VRALVTGAGGFLGQHVVAALQSRGVSVRAMVRPASKVERLGWPADVEVVRADLRATRDLSSLFDGVDVLVHLAASVTGGEDMQFASAVTGTERLLDAMAGTSCKRVVLASSFSVYDWSAITGTLDETSPIEPSPDLYERDGYSIAKSWQERVTRRLSEKHGFELTVLRPGFIWGRDHAFLAAMSMPMGKLHLVINPLARMPMTHVENCADLFAVAATDRRAVGRTFNVVDGPGERIWSFMGTYLKRTGEKGVRIPLPYGLTLAGVRLFYSTIFRRNQKLPQILIPVRFESRLKGLRFTNRLAAEVLGWKPPLDLATCLDRTFGKAPTPARGAAAAGGPTLATGT